jgi:hypothetical protein
MIAPWVIKGAMDGPAFAAYVEKVLIAELAPGTVVILDNLATHKNATAAKAVRTPDAGSCSSRLTARTSIPSKWPSPSSRLISGALERGPSANSSRPSGKSVISSYPTNVETSSRPQAMPDE